MVTPYAEGALVRRAQTTLSVPISALIEGKALLVLTPHPDDESLGCGAAIAAAAEADIDIVIVCLTDGAGSHPNSLLFPRDKLVSLRRAELETATGILTDGGGRVLFLGLPDQGLTPELLASCGVITTLQRLLDVNAIRTVWTTWGGDPHIDHQHAAKIATNLAARNPAMSLWQFPIWGRFTDSEPALSQTLHVFHAEEFAEKKRRAVAAHTSQMSHLISDDPYGFVLDPEAQNHFVNFPEIFIGKPQNE